MVMARKDTVSPSAASASVSISATASAPDIKSAPQASAPISIPKPSPACTLGDFRREIIKMLDEFKYDEERCKYFEDRGLRSATHTLIHDLTHPDYVEFIGYYKDADREKLRAPFTGAKFHYSRWLEVFNSVTKGLWDGASENVRARVKEFCPELFIQCMYDFLGSDKHSILKKDEYYEIPAKVALAMVFRYAKENAPLLVKKPVLKARSAPAGIAAALIAVDAAYNPSYFKHTAAVYARSESASVPAKAAQEQEAILAGPVVLRNRF